MAHFIVLREPASGAPGRLHAVLELGRRSSQVHRHRLSAAEGMVLYFRLWDAAVDWALARGARVDPERADRYAPKIETGQPARCRSQLLHAPQLRRDAVARAAPATSTGPASTTL